MGGGVVIGEACIRLGGAGGELGVMGHSKKKKKRNKGGQGRAPSKDQSHSGDDQDLLSDELTAL